MRILFLAALLACTTPALAMTDAERNIIAAAAIEDPTGWSRQETVNTVRRLGSVGDLKALDFLLSLNHWSLADAYVSGYREAQFKDHAPIEHRLIAHYDNPRLALTLMRGVDKYASLVVLDRLLGDATRLAKIYADEAKRCKIFAMEQQYLPDSPPDARLAPQSNASFGMKPVVEGRAKTPKLDCTGAASPADLERSRMQAAVRLLGKTDRTDAAHRIRPLLAALTVTPLARDEDAGAMASAWTASRVKDMHAIAGLIGRQQYRDAGADLTAMIRKMSTPARTELHLVAAWPLMQALGQLDRPEGTQAIAEWIEWRSAGKIDAAMTPTIADMARLLGRVLPEAQIDVAALRRRVMPRVPDEQRVDYEKAFDAAERANQELCDPKETTLIVAALEKNPRLVRYILSRGITPNAHDSLGDTALTAVVGHAQHAYREVFTILIDAGANPDGPGRDGMTPFHHAVAWFSPLDAERYKMLDFWHAQKADVNRAAKEGTPLGTAAAGSTDMVKYLLERGANPEIASHAGLTPLHAAARRGRVGNIKQLLAAGARVDAKDQHKYMPLHFAVRSESIESAELLLKAGADVNAEIDEGLTPLLIAQDNKNPAMEALLKHHGGRVNLTYQAKRSAVMMLFRFGH